jgi:hypothetical protein
MHRFSMHMTEERGDRRQWIRHRLKANELRMVLVALRLPSQNLLSQQPFAPHRNKPCRIKIFRMKRPKSHWSESI